MMCCDPLWKKSQAFGCWFVLGNASVSDLNLQVEFIYWFWDNLGVFTFILSFLSWWHTKILFLATWKSPLLQQWDLYG